MANKARIKTNHRTTSVILPAETTAIGGRRLAALRKHGWAVATIILLALGAFGAGLKYLEDSARQRQLMRQQNGGAADKEKASLLDAVNPFLPDPTPTPAPQLAKEYIYAGSRMLAVEDANASAVPPADLAVWRPSTGYWYVLGGQGSQPTNFLWGASTDLTVPGDYDGDGKTDFSVYRPSTGYWYVSQSGNGYTIESYFGADTDKVAQADYDGDGKTDRAVFRSANGLGYWYILRSSDGGTTSLQFGADTDSPAAADYDGDGKADIAVWRTSNQTFYVVRSSDGQLQGQTISGTLTSPLPVSADYDGDGRADFAVKSGNQWTIVNSATNTTQTTTWQQAGDVAVQNDYDGDGKVDIAVWRASIGWWFIRQSSRIGQTNELREAQWGGTINGVPDIPVPAFYRR